MARHAVFLAPDVLQKTIREVCERDCYPPIAFRTDVLEIDGQNVIGIEVPASNNRPHFAGQSYVRRASETVTASAESFDELVASRLAKPREILKWKNQLIAVIARAKELGSTRILGDPRYRAEHQCRVLECNAHYVRLQDIASDRYVTEPLENVQLARDEGRKRLMLIIQEAAGP